MKLYKYLSPNRIDVLTDCRIRYTQPGAFNDPFEAKPHITTIVEPDKAERRVDEIFLEETQKMYDKLSAEAKSRVPYDLVKDLAIRRRESLRGDFGRMVKDATPLLRRIIDEKFNELIGILTLSEKPDNILMWSHYAASHEGFVLGFDSTNEYFNQRMSSNDEFRYLRKVEYRLQRPNAPLTTLDGVDVFLVKSKDWEYEQEWRIMRPLTDAVSTIPAQPFPIRLFSYPSSALVEVVIGARMREVDRAAVFKAIHAKHFAHVKVFQVLPDDKEFKIVLKNVE